jgi:ElaB/YqjD/DUF883 family membrane-anchored ribosome-binding protein
MTAGLRVLHEIERALAETLSRTATALVETAPVPGQEQTEALARLQARLHELETKLQTTARGVEETEYELAEASEALRYWVRQQQSLRQRLEKLMLGAIR